MRTPAGRLGKASQRDGYHRPLVERSSPSTAPSAGGVEDVADTVEVVCERVMAGVDDAELAVEGADSRSQLPLDPDEEHPSPQPPRPHLLCRPHLQYKQIR